MKYHAFEDFSWLPWLIIAMALAGVALLIVLAVRARRVLWKVVLELCVPVCMIASCAGFIYAAYVDVPPTNASAPVPDLLSISFLQYPNNSATAVTTLNAHTGAVRAQSSFTGIYDRYSVADEHTLYLVGATTTFVTAVHMSDGNELWRTSLFSPTHPQQRLVPDGRSILADGMLYLTTRGDVGERFILGLNAGTGEVA